MPYAIGTICKEFISKNGERIEVVDEDTGLIGYIRVYKNRKAATKYIKEEKISIVSYIQIKTAAIYYIAITVLLFSVYGYVVNTLTILDTLCVDAVAKQTLEEMGL